MSQEIECACKDCKQAYYISSSRKWKESLEYHKFLEIHQDHNIICYSTDFVTMRGNDLVNDHPYLEESELTLLIENYSDYKKETI